MTRCDHLETNPSRRLERRAQTVTAPVHTDGVGLALRCAYLPRASDMPNDLSALLDALDR